jgi:hypothetical protein
MMSGCRPINSCASARVPIGVTAVLTKVYPPVAAIAPTQARKRLCERREARLRQGIVFVERDKHADAPHAPALLCPPRDRPCHRAAEPNDEFAPSKPNEETPIDGE